MEQQNEVCNNQPKGMLNLWKTITWHQSTGFWWELLLCACSGCELSEATSSVRLAREGVSQLTGTRSSDRETRRDWKKRWSLLQQTLDGNNSTTNSVFAAIVVFVVKSDQWALDLAKNQAKRTSRSRARYDKKKMEDQKHFLKMF